MSRNTKRLLPACAVEPPTEYEMLRGHHRRSLELETALNAIANIAPTHGGKRPGAGRPAQGLARHQVMLDPATVAKARIAGAGNLSAGLRAIVGASRPTKAR